MKKRANEVTRLIYQYFNTEITTSDWKTLEEKLSHVVLHFLNNDFKSLLNAMYKIDVNEDDFKLAISSEEPHQKIAVLIIDRMLKKIESRYKYSNE